MRTALAAWLGTVVLLPGIAQAQQEPGESKTESGVSMPTEVKVGDNLLVLNGMATRKKVVVKVYVAGLYLAQPSSNADQILSTDSPRRIVMHFVHDVGADKLCDAWEESLENNTPDASDDLKGQFKQLCSDMVDVKSGEEFVFTYLPNAGTTITVTGTDKSVIPGKPFADALFRSWIGPKPGPGEGFKKKILGLD